MRRALLGVAMLALAAGAGADDTWRVPAADLRVPLRVAGDLYARTDAELTALLDFNTLLGSERVLAADSLVLVDAADGQTLPVQLAQDAALRYASGNPVLRLRWTMPTLAAFATRPLHLYCRTVPPGEAAAWQPLTETFTPGGDGGFATSFEAPDPAHADGPRFFTPAGRDQPGETSERVWSDQQARTGRRSLKVARTFAGDIPANTNRPFWWSWPPPIGVREGQSVRLEAWLKAVRLKARAMAYLSLQFTDERNQRLREGMLSLRGDSEVHDWKCVSGVATAPAGARGAVVSFSLVGDEGEVYCDDLSVTLVPGSSLPALPVTAGAVERRPEAAAQTPTASKVLSVGQAAQPPTIDGALDDPCWASAGRSSDFAAHSQAADVAPVATTVLACADEEALYFGFICQEPPGATLLAAATERDGPLWKDDSVELFLDTNLDRHTYYQIIVNSRGALFDQDTGAPGLAGAKWNGPITAAARVYPDRWTAEVKLQFVGLRLAEAAGSQWGANFARTSFRGSRSLYTWAKVGANFGEPARFGTLALPFDPAANVIGGRPLLGERLYFGPGTVPVEITNRRDRPAPVRVVLTVEDGAQPTPLGETVLMAPPQGVTVAHVPCAFSQPGPVKLRYELFEQPAARLLYTTSVTHLVPEPLTLQPAQQVLYTSETAVTGRWSVGLDPAALGQSALQFTLTPEGATQPGTPCRVPLDGPEGHFSLPGNLAPGTYIVRAQLLQGGQPLADASYRLGCLVGPFAPPR